MTRNRTRMTVALSAVAGFSLLLTACGGDSDTATPVATEAPGATATETTAPAAAAATIELQDIKFDVTELSAAAGQTLELTIKNTGMIDHDFTIDEIAGEATVNGATAASGDWDVHVATVAGGESTLLLTPTTAGTYEFYCTVLGHKEAGMVGTLTVQ
ncbi:MAG: plastocyanin/azurin family copper-binding protein [Chloroflexi bacterium]|nr:plastocyanin/azurin family copper-binding protein [Chloroflexota bacterium]